MILKFEEWLNNQQYRNDLIGDLARLPSLQNADLKSSRRKSDEHKNWADIVISIADPEHVAVFNEAWQEFLLAKQADTDAHE
jgi:hypothetical protein